MPWLAWTASNRSRNSRIWTSRARSAAPLRESARNNLRTSSLFSKTATLLLVISLVPVVIIGFMQMQIVQGALEKDFEVFKSKLAERAAKNGTDYIKNVTELLATFGELDEISTLKALDYVPIIRQVLMSHRQIAELDLYDSAGRWLFGMEAVPGSISKEYRPGELLPVVQETIRRMGRFRGNIVRVSGHPGIELFIPLRRRHDRQAMGYMRGVITLFEVSEALSDARIGKSSELMILDYKNKLLAHSNYKTVLRDGGDEAVDPVILDKIGKLGAYQTWSGRLKLKDKRDVIAAFHKLEDQPWVAVSLQERWEAFDIMLTMRQKIIEVMLTVGLVVLIAALFFAGRISTPIRSLTNAVRQLMAVDFSQPITDPLPKPANEIGILASAFETMSKVLANRTQELNRVQGNLQRFNVELEARIEARTKELRVTQEELIRQERLAALGQMASVVGHELRNPLSVINNSIYVIKTRLDGEHASIAPGPESSMAGTQYSTPRSQNLLIDPKIIRHVNIIEGELHVANQIISEILTFARTRELHVRDVNLHDFLEEVISRISTPETVSIQKKYSAEPISLKADPDELRQAVRNLIVNAVDAMPNGGAVTVATSSSDLHVLLTVSDTGTGIPPDIAAKVFTAFFSTKAKGTGLGLAVVKKVMERHNGEVDLESALGKGTTFKLKFPRK